MARGACGIGCRWPCSGPRVRRFWRRGGAGGEVWLCGRMSSPVAQPPRQLGIRRGSCQVSSLLSTLKCFNCFKDGRDIENIGSGYRVWVTHSSAKWEVVLLGGGEWRMICHFVRAVSVRRAKRDSSHNGKMLMALVMEDGYLCKPAETKSLLLMVRGLDYSR